MSFRYNVSITRIKLFIGRCAQAGYEARGSCCPSCFSGGYAYGHGLSAHRAAHREWRRSSSPAGRRRRTGRAPRWASLYSRLLQTKQQTPSPSVEVSWSVMMASEHCRLGMFMLRQLNIRTYK